MIDLMGKTANTTFAESMRRVLSAKFSGNMSELARAVGVSPSTVKRWIEIGMVPKSDRIARICLVTGITPAELLGDDVPRSQRFISSFPAPNNSDQARAVDWFVRQGHSPDQVATAASIVSRMFASDGISHGRLWWVDKIGAVLVELGE